MKSSEIKGYITVYFSLTIGIMLSFLVTIMEGIRMKTIQFETECVMDIGLNSIFAEYNREMWKQYNLLLIDSSYSAPNASDENTKRHLLDFMNKNFIKSSMIAGRGKDLTAIHADNADLFDVSYASDQDGSVVQYQIIKLMRDQKGISLVDGADMSYDEYKKQEQEYEKYNQNRFDNKKEIDGMIEEINMEKEEGEEDICIDNPADSVEDLSSGWILQYALAEGTELSSQTCNLSEYVSHRSRQKGSGLRSNQNLGFNLIDKQLYHSYLMSKCGYYQKKKESALLHYQIEYLLKGNESDRRNLELVAEQIFKIRYGINMAYLFSDGQKQLEAEELALAITSSVGQPALCEAVKLSILFAWGYAESAKDIRILFDGNKIPDSKTATTWNTPLSQMITFKSHLGEYRVTNTGRNYKDYLSAFLYLTKEKTLNMRLLDLMEMDIRKTNGNSYFKADHCIYQLTAQVNVSSQYGYGYQIMRSFSYE